ncbi:hypothetical protein TSAR_007108 [Trichomalopsis sarcophagae]|uniref:Tc1-like transposase DDE domain-containing protein n=1 Tax=Trichomalopsis sarcophagae TaxID=543379 RepID=A0A232EX02_9HYME|nr:hypothetical protein TSAR_007108 [Trichomalopsis sarcophagae]
MRALWRRDERVGVIAQYFDCTQQTVRNWIRRFEKEDKNNLSHDLRADNSGSRLASRSVERVRHAILENPFQPVCRIPEALGLDVGEQTPRTSIKSRLHTGTYWAWISGDGPGDLVAIERRLNSETYVQILNDYLLPGVNARYPVNEPVFVIEDNSPIHTARVVAEWYADHPKLQRLNHLP